MHPSSVFRRRHWLPIVIAALPLALAGCGKKQAAAAPPPPQAGFITIKNQPVLRTTDLPGRTSPVFTAEIRPQVSGVILKRLFVEGTDVTAGQQLYLIDPATYKANYDTAQATLAYDQAAYVTAAAKAARYQPLAAAQAVSEQDYDDAVAAEREALANIAAAKASVEQAEINLQYTKMLSPIAGTIGASTVTPGALVTANQTSVLATVTQLDPIYVDVNESSTTWLRLKQEMDAGVLETAGDGTAQVSLQLEDGTPYSLPGKLQFAEVNVDETTGTVLVRAIFPNPKHLLLPGMYVHAELQEGVNNNGILVPQQAVSHNTHGDPTVLLIGDKNIVSEQVIQTGTNVGNNWVVTGGINPGDRVIVDGLLNATVGQAVAPVDETASFSPKPASQSPAP